jgi:predicted alpha/beta-fold hydrolase
VPVEWMRGGFARLAVLGHGMEGSARSAYVRGLRDSLYAAGWDVVAWNMRGCGGEVHPGSGWYHAGQTEDLRAVVSGVAPGYDRVALVGFSLGGNLLLKYLGEGGVAPVVHAAVAVSAPLDLEASALALDERFSNQLYLRNFLRSFRARIAVNHALFPPGLRARASSPVSMREVDAWYTAPMYGFESVTAYWRSCSAVKFLTAIRIPTLVLNARDDPFLTPESFPEDVFSGSRYAFLEAPQHGGHVAFWEWNNGLHPWWEGRVADFLESVS